MKQMMKKYLYMAAVAVVGTGFLMSSCKDEFAGQNTNPSTVSKPNVRYLFTQCAMSFQPADYLQWFAGFDAMSTWVQATASGGGNSSKLNMVTQTGCGYQVNEVLRYTNEIKHQISLMSDDEKVKYEYIAYLCNPMLVYLGLEDSDMYGSRQYSEAEMARYGGTLTPKYDTQEELFELWLKQLDETINYLRENNPQDVLGAQDFIYRGKLDKWAKLANSLKLRIAARLINKDKARAIAIVNEAAQNPAGLILTLDDDFVFNKGKRDNNWNNDISVGAGAGVLIGRKMDKKAAEAAKIKDAQVEQVTDNNGLAAVKVTFPSGILFAFNSSALSAASKQSLAEFANILKEDPTVDVAIIGHTDKVGSYEANQKVSANRAYAVENYLQACGVKPYQFKKVEGVGYSQYNESETPEQNRRVEIFMYASEQMIKNAEAGK
jgi:outer membrane protein OmpA-like peptidoglycan-associated protein